MIDSYRRHLIDYGVQRVIEKTSISPRRTEKYKCNQLSIRNNRLRTLVKGSPTGNIDLLNPLPRGRDTPEFRFKFL